MPNYFIDSPEYWSQVPKRLEPLREVGGAQGMLPTYFVMGDEPTEDVPVAVAIEFQPHCWIRPHAHPCHRFEVVVRGTLTTENGDVLRPGDVMMARPGEVYGPSVAGPEGCTTIEIFPVLSAAHLVYVHDDAGELVLRDNLEIDPEELRQRGAAARSHGMQLPSDPRPVPDADPSSN